MEPFWVSLLAVAIGEIGDKTQILALVLAARFRRPLPIIAGMTLAALGNHVAAVAVGQSLSHLLHGNVLQWLLALSFFAVAFWALKTDPTQENRTLPRYGVFAATFITFFLAEMGDKTQIATVVLAAKYHAPAAVLSGATIGMLLIDLPTVLFGRLVVHRLPLRAVRLFAFALFFVLGLGTVAAAHWPAH